MNVFEVKNMRELPPPIEIYSNIDKFVRDYAAVHDKRRPQNIYSGIRGAFESLLQLTRKFDDAGQEGRISSGEVYVFPGIKPPQKGAYGAQTEWGAKVPRFTREELEALECP